MDGGDDYVPGLPIAQQLFRTQNPVSIGYGLLVERVGFAERLAVPGTPYPVSLPDVLIGQSPWRMHISETLLFGNERIRYVSWQDMNPNANPNQPVWAWPDGIDVNPNNAFSQT